MSAKVAGSVHPANASLRPVLNHLKDVEKTVAVLQHESDVKHLWEKQTQQNFDFLQNQIQALRSAFTTLSEVIVSEIEEMRTEVRSSLTEVDSLRTRVTGAEDAVRALASELAGWRSTSDKRMATITAGVNLLNNKLHEYQTENARELANQRARIATLEQAKVDERSVLNMNSTVVSRDIARLQEQLASFNQESRLVRDKQQADIQQIFHALQQVNSTTQTATKSLSDASVTKAQLESVQNRIIDECASLVNNQQASSTAAIQTALEASRSAQRDWQMQAEALRAELASLRNGVDVQSRQTMELLKNDEEDSADFKNTVEKAFALLAQHLSIANPFQVAVAGMSPTEMSRLSMPVGSQQSAMTASSLR